MKRLARGILSAVLCAALLLGLVLSASASSTVYLMAVNDKLVEMTPDNMPFLSGGVLYVPYTMLSSRANGGINLGVNTQYSVTRGTVLVSSSREGVTFDTRNNTAYDFQGNTVNAQAVTRNSMVYIPLDWVCGYFQEISYTTIRTNYGILIRVTNSSAILSNADLVDYADSMLQANLRSYQEELARRNSASSSAPEPSQSSGVGTGPEVCLAFRWGERAAETAERLEAAGQQALFLFTAEELAEQDGLVRRLAAAGHVIGLALTGDSVEACLSQAKEGSLLLAHAARCAVQIVSADGLDGEGREALKSAGYVLWTANVPGDEAASASELLQKIVPDRVNYVELTCGETGYAILSSALWRLTGSEFRPTRAVAPVL